MTSVSHFLTLIRPAARGVPGVAVALFLIAAIFQTENLSAEFRSSADRYTVLDPDKAATMMDDFFARLIREAGERRLERYESIETREDVERYQAMLLERFRASLGEFPQRTPLNARVVDRLDFEDYRVEKIIYESQPRHYVTAILFLPMGEGPHPAVLIPCGHARTGKGSVTYQRGAILLARNGFAALIYDPIGQGERYHVLNDENQPVFSPVEEHQILSPSCVLLGRNVATYRIWDGIRSIDYLVSRDDIDADRIGAAGNSGGGTLTSYLGVLDERLAVTAPSCYLTTFQHLFNTIGPTDAEQLIFGQLEYGMDHADYVTMRAPKPTLICAMTHDFFAIEGTWQSYREAKRIYGRLGHPERVAIVEDDGRHGWSDLLRLATARWMARWLKGADDLSAGEAERPVLTAEDVQVTDQGQVLLIDGYRSVVDINVDFERQLAVRRARLWEEPVQALEEVRKLTGIARFADLPGFPSRTIGSIEDNGFRIDKILLDVDEGLSLPGLLYRPEKPSGSGFLHLNGQGKLGDAADGVFASRARKGDTVLALDPRGIGELAGQPRFDRRRPVSGPNWSDASTAYLLGGSLVAMRAEDVLAGARRLMDDGGIGESMDLHLVATGAAGVPALHAAALEPDLFATVTIRHALLSYRTVVERVPEMSRQLAQVVHGALTVYDLTDLAAVLGDRLRIEEPIE